MFKPNDWRLCRLWLSDGFRVASHGNVISSSDGKMLGFSLGSLRSCCSNKLPQVRPLLWSWSLWKPQHLDGHIWPRRAEKNLVMRCLEKVDMYRQHLGCCQQLRYLLRSLKIWKKKGVRMFQGIQVCFPWIIWILRGAHRSCKARNPRLLWSVWSLGTSDGAELIKDKSTRHWEISTN